MKNFHKGMGLIGFGIIVSICFSGNDYISFIGLILGFIGLCLTLST